MRKITLFAVLFLFCASAFVVGDVNTAESDTQDITADNDASLGPQIGPLCVADADDPNATPPITLGLTLGTVIGGGIGGGF